MTTKYPTYNDLCNFIKEFDKAGMDVRLFYYKDIIENNTIQFGKYPVLKQYNINDPLNNSVIMSEIQSVKNQKDFDKCVKPYPDRDIYYNILIHDLDDIHKFITYWLEKNNQN